MSSPAADPQQQEAPSEEAALALIVLALLASGTAAQMAGQMLEVLSSLGIPAEASADALALILPHRLELPESNRTPKGAAQRGEFALRARYILNAARRLAGGGTLAAERRYLAQHIAARKARGEAAEQVQDMVSRVGPVVGWYAVLDSRTDPVCRLAHGTNFDARVPSPIGYPGSLHGGACRCRAGRPHPRGAALVDVLQAAVERRDIEFTSDPDRVVDLTGPRGHDRGRLVGPFTSSSWN